MGLPFFSHAPRDALGDSTPPSPASLPAHSLGLQLASSAISQSQCHTFWSFITMLTSLSDLNCFSSYLLLATNHSKFLWFQTRTVYFLPLLCVSHLGQLSLDGLSLFHTMLAGLSHTLAVSLSVHLQAGWSRWPHSFQLARDPSRGASLLIHVASLPGNLGFPCGGGDIPRTPMCRHF